MREEFLVEDDVLCREDLGLPGGEWSAGRDTGNGPHR